MMTRVWLVAVLISLLCSCAGVEVGYRYPGPVYSTSSGVQHREMGIASYYADKYQNRLTANGERFDQRSMTAAHKTLPFDSVVRVVNVDNGRSVIVRINDRGPFIQGRIIDLSFSAFSRIESPRQGLAEVVIEVID